jgi:quinol monooxygenase YgiN
MIVELRQYTLHPGRRDALIDIFERELVEPQERAGMRLVGQFRDLDDPDRFVWLRAFPDMPSRARALDAFYTGPVWRRHRDAANALMIDTDDVLLLRPARPESGFAGADHQSVSGEGVFVAAIHSLPAPAGSDPLEVFDGTLAPALTAAGASRVAVLVTEPSENTYPRLPVREGENVFVWLARFADRAACERHVAAVAGSPGWAPAQVLRLEPTPRSALA